LSSLPSPAAAAVSELERANALDALASILPLERRDQLALLLTDDDVATLWHIAQEGLGENTLRALASDLAYLEAWSLAATGWPLPWPAPEALVLKFIAHHLWDPGRRESDPGHGMPAPVERALRAQGILRASGPHAPSTVKRRLAHWGTLHRWRGKESPLASPQLRAALRLAVRASSRPRTRKSRRAVTKDVLERMLQTCALDRLTDVRDRALLLVAFASGGRRRSEVAALRLEQIVGEPPVPARPEDPDSPRLRCLAIQLGRTKTGVADEDRRVLVIGRAADALLAWIERAGITRGAVFRAVDRWGRMEATALSPQAVNLIVKKRAEAAGLDPREVSAHGLRSGYLTESARRGVPLVEAMQQSQHRSVQQAAAYYNEVERRNGRAARLI
jgi:integrase